MKPTVKLPSFGFVAIVMAYVGLVLFLVWGFSKPPLERVWELHHELKIGMVGALSAKDHRLLSASLARHPQLADALLSETNIGLISAHSQGWLETPNATIIRAPTAPHPCKLGLEVSIPPELLPLTVQLNGKGWEKKLTISKQGLTEFDLPPGPKGAEIITLNVASKEGAQEVITLGVRVSFSCASARKTMAERDDDSDEPDAPKGSAEHD